MIKHITVTLLRLGKYIALPKCRRGYSGQVTELTDCIPSKSTQDTFTYAVREGWNSFKGHQGTI